VNTKAAARAVVSRRFAAPAGRLYEAWLKPELIERWMFGPAVRDEEIVHLAVDPREGGAFSFMVERNDEMIEHIGKYLEMKRPTRLVFTWMIAGAEMGSRVLLDFAEEGETCTLTLTHELHPTWAEHVGKMEGSWAKLLGGLATVVESGRA